MPEPAISFRATNAARFYASRSKGPVVTLPAGAAVEGHHVYVPKSRLDSSFTTEKTVTYVAPSATGEGVHTRWCDIEDPKAEEEAPWLGEDVVSSPRSLSLVRKEFSLPSSEAWSTFNSTRSLEGSVLSLGSCDAAFWAQFRQNASPVNGPEDNDDSATEYQSSRSLYPDGSATLGDISEPVAPHKWAGSSNKATSSEWAPRTRVVPLSCSEAMIELVGDAWDPPRQDASPVYALEGEDSSATEYQPSRSLYPDGSATLSEIPGPAAAPHTWVGPSNKAASSEWAPRTRVVPVSEAMTELVGDAWAPPRQDASPVYAPEEDDDDDNSANEHQSSGFLNPDDSTVGFPAPATASYTWDGPSKRGESGEWVPRTRVVPRSEAVEQLWEKPLVDIGYQSAVEKPIEPLWMPAEPCTGCQMRLHYEDGDKRKKLLTCNFDPFDPFVDPTWSKNAIDLLNEGRKLIIVD
ncbi:hypothetical protein EIP86_005202 [Pleurotus ostreatoroseus]|nr:hypothetical protein EIP86_005202 [Pleurotus ostreatoroseus]